MTLLWQRPVHGVIDYPNISQGEQVFKTVLLHARPITVMLHYSIVPVIGSTWEFQGLRLHDNLVVLRSATWSLQTTLWDCRDPDCSFRGQWRLCRYQLSQCVLKRRQVTMKQLYKEASARSSDRAKALQHQYEQVKHRYLLYIVSCLFLSLWPLYFL